MYLYGVFCVCVCVCVCARVWSIGEGDAFLGVYRRCGGRGQASCCHWIGQVSDRYCPSCLQGTYMFGLIYIYIFISRARALAHAHNTQIHMHTHIRTHTQTYIHTYICVNLLYVYVNTYDMKEQALLIEKATRVRRALGLSSSMALCECICIC